MHVRTHARALPFVHAAGAPGSFPTTRGWGTEGWEGMIDRRARAVGGSCGTDRACLVVLLMDPPWIFSAKLVEYGRRVHYSTCESALSDG